VIGADDPSESHQRVPDEVAENDREKRHPEPHGGEKPSRPDLGEGNRDTGPQQKKVHPGKIPIGGDGGFYVHAGSREGVEG
jgi:hypothetical protein